MGWTQLYVKAPPGNGYTNAGGMKRIDEHLMSIAPAAFVAPNGLPIQEPDGTWEVRVLDSGCTKAVERLLTGLYGLEIVRKQENE